MYDPSIGQFGPITVVVGDEANRKFEAKDEDVVVIIFGDQPDAYGYMECAEARERAILPSLK